MSWIQTYTGKKFYPLEPRAEDVCIEDIAHHLALTNRFSGATALPYSVAQHSVLVSLHVPPRLALHGLLHDAAEAYLADIPGPIKGDLPRFAAIERRLLQVIGAALDVPDLALHWNEVALADARACMTEARDLMGPKPAPWGLHAEPWPERIFAWRWPSAELQFRTAYAEFLFRRVSGKEARQMLTQHQAAEIAMNYVLLIEAGRDVSPFFSARGIVGAAKRQVLVEATRIWGERQREEDEAAHHKEMVEALRGYDVRLLARLVAQDVDTGLWKVNLLSPSSGAVLAKTLGYVERSAAEASMNAAIGAVLRAA